MTKQSPYPGLLPYNAADKEAALFQGLLGLGSQLGGGMSFDPANASFAGRLGRAGASFGKNYRDSLSTSRSDQLENMQFQKGQAEMDAERLKIEAAKRQAELRRAFESSLAPSNNQDVITAMGGQGGQMGPTPQAAAAIPGAMQKAQQIPGITPDIAMGMGVENYG